MGGGGSKCLQTAVLYTSQRLETGAMVDLGGKSVDTAIGCTRYPKHIPINLVKFII